MLAANKPVSFPIPFGASAGGGYIRTIPVGSQIGIVGGQASLTDGFVPLNATLRSAGGIPPDIKDMNGILFEITALQQWLAGGGLPAYDATFQSGAGGYPNGAVILNASKTAFWKSTADNNMTNPDTGGAGWSLMNQPWLYSDAGGTVNAITGTFTPTLLTLTDGLTVTVHVTATNNSTIPTFQADATTAHTIVKGAGNPLQPGDLLGMMILTYDLTNTRWVLHNPCTPVTTSPSYSKVSVLTTTTVLDNTYSGAVIVSNAAGTSNYTLPAANSCKAGTVIEFLNVNFGSSSVIRAGADTITAGGTTGLTTSPVMLNGDMVRFTTDGASVWYCVGGNMQIKYAAAWGSSNANPGYLKMPNGIIMQWGQVTNSGTPGNPTAVTFPIAFPVSQLVIMNTAAVASATAQSAWTDTGSTTGFNSRALTATCLSQWLAFGI
jgi:hypothetical protein